jgi:hypothetical protein
MDPESEKPLRLFVNPFAMWTDLAFKTAEAMWASAHAAVVRQNAPKVAVIPTADAPAPKPLPVADRPPRKAQAVVRQASKATRFKATRPKLRSKAHAKRRAQR